MKRVAMHFFKNQELLHKLFLTFIPKLKLKILYDSKQ